MLLHFVPLCHARLARLLASNLTKLSVMPIPAMASVARSALVLLLRTVAAYEEVGAVRPSRRGWPARVVDGYEVEAVCTPAEYREAVEGAIQASNALG